MTTGLRRRELGHLKVDDIKFIDFETVHIFSVGKGGKHNRTVLKGIVAVEKLKEYINRAEKWAMIFIDKGRSSRPRWTPLLQGYVRTDYI